MPRLDIGDITVGNESGLIVLRTYADNAPAEARPNNEIVVTPRQALEIATALLGAAMQVIREENV